MQTPDPTAARQSLRALYAEIVAAYNEKKRAMDAQFVLYRVLYRPLSFPLTVLFIRAGFSANQVSLLNALLLLVVLALLASGHALLMFAGALFFFLFYVLDFVDGNIARYRQQSSYFGKLIDGTIDSAAFLVFAAVAYGNARSGDTLLAPHWETALGIVTVIAALFNQNAVFRMAYLNLESEGVQGGSGEKARTPARQARPGGGLRFANDVYQNALVSTPVILFATMLVGGVTMFTLFFAFVHAGMGLAATLVGMLRARRHLDRARSY